MLMQTTVNALFPVQCLTCSTMVEDELALCGSCRAETHFISGVTCDACGIPLPGEDHGFREICDECADTPRPWHKCRSALVYSGMGRRLVMGLKHNDRTEYARPAARWMAAIAPDLHPRTVIVPVPLHWTRYLKRRYNQSALIARHLAPLLGLEVELDALRRPRATPALENASKDKRFATMAGAISPHPKNGPRIKDRPVLLIDDVMTSGATLSASTDAAFAAGAASVDVVTLARAVKDA